GVDAQNHGVNFVALLEVANGFFASLGPGQVGQVNQTVDAARQTNKHAEVGDGLDATANLVAALEVDGEIFPWVGTALLHAQGDTTTIFVDFQNHDFDFLTQGHNLAWVNVLVGPIHFGYVNQTFDTVFHFNKCTVVGQVGNLAEQTGVLWVATCQTDPWIFAQLLDAQGDAALFLIELEDLGFDFLTHLQNFGWVTNTAPCHVG